jgi:hypothetical protein
MHAIAPQCVTSNDLRAQTHGKNDTVDSTMQNTPNETAPFTNKRALVHIRGAAKAKK